MYICASICYVLNVFSRHACASSQKINNKNNKFTKLVDEKNQ